ncbi:MAG: glutamate ligase domain-containing protein, partial [Candidatus Competibacterales bacterium]
DPEAMAGVLRRFDGLYHRCQHLATVGGVRYIDENKATNVGAAVAAVASAADHGKVVLIAGGVGKGQDFTPLAAALGPVGRAAVLMGRDAPRLAAVLEGVVPVVHVRDMDQAVERAAALAEPGDAVLLAPACASFDLYRDFAARGDAFAQAVQGRSLCL